MDNLPQDARVIEQILHSMGIEEYDPQVLPQLLEFIQKYTSEVLEKAQKYAQHAKRNQIEESDVTLAITNQVAYSFQKPPSRKLLADFAKARNAVPFPQIRFKYGVHLPTEEYSLTNANYQIDEKYQEK
ncbi:taf9 RNA polymerase ii tata box-binding protein (tbp)-associated factor [Anaeramoeba ignava]|uniref:Taf9 RNA polymerase ii tata box-binding protein (Tbp)-associated factor n=1 Tax=Anaeramoeba ignava TaxID=1746090 RepID=A0A9Q0L7B7_ANAIG|nr:taf9 RNA polymerase ii tata box-binding protein (tbp)-associated factor [Anaeramoeba ignava]|eukprot:Anaeramoba_ignava/a1230_32.p1 GENE.a1230_32~~a1230_32.p1  ORF type:complete len:129 (+),score=53.53 a1230_32:290-676(+)